MTADLAKINAAAAALDYVKDGMTLGLGTGSTAAHFVRLLGERVRQGLHVKGVPTSEATKALAEEAGVPLLSISQVTSIDVDVDGAGRILIPGPLRRFAGLEKDVALIGQGVRFELWDEAKWGAQMEKSSVLSQDDVPHELDGFSL